MSSFDHQGDLSKETLDVIVESLKRFLSSSEVRALNQRAVQAKAWHIIPEISTKMSHLRREEGIIRERIMSKMSALVYNFHAYTLDATLARAGTITDERVHSGSSLENDEDFDLLCLDSKERLYLILKQYGWLEEFFRNYPQHFYENSFIFVDMIPVKKLHVKIKVVGLGIAGSLAVSGLAKLGIENVSGYEQRQRIGPGGACSRYQNASWRAYDVSKKMLDNKAYEHLKSYQQKLKVQYDDGSSKIVSTDRVQIIIGDAVNSALDSATRFGAELHFGCSEDSYRISSISEGTDRIDATHISEVDIVALFCGAHTPYLFEGLAQELDVMAWEELNSVCNMWLQLKKYENSNDISTEELSCCTRGGEVGAEKWHYTIGSVRNNVEDVLRAREALRHQFKWKGDANDEILSDEFICKHRAINELLNDLQSDENSKFEYVFTNAPSNSHNHKKRADLGQDGSVVLDGGYIAEVKLARHSTVRRSSFSSSSNCNLLNSFSANLIVTGGDACVPPNPLAAYGATLACEAANMLVELAVAYGHLNAISKSFCAVKIVGDKNEELQKWLHELGDLKDLFAEYYDARSKSENFFQWIQTLICNLYSLPPFY